MAVGQVYRLAVRSTYNNVDDMINVFHYRQELVVIGNPAEDLANQWVSDVMTTYQGVISGSVTIAEVNVRPVPPATEFFDLALTGIVGSLSGEALPLMNAGIITWRTALIGRRNRGRSYLPVGSENLQNAGSWLPAYIANMDAFAVANMQLLELGVPQWQLVIHSEVGGTDTPVIDHVSRPLIGTQRRRKQGVGG